MKKLVLSILLFVPATLSASYLDVIKFELNEGCSFAEFMAITADFNRWGADNGYHARVAMPLQDTDLNSFYWLGEAENAAAFGKAWDTWRDGLADPDSTPAKLWDRFQACSTNMSRWGYDVY